MQDISDAPSIQEAPNNLSFASIMGDCQNGFCASRSEEVQGVLPELTFGSCSSGGCGPRSASTCDQGDCQKIASKAAEGGCSSGGGCGGGGCSAGGAGGGGGPLA